LASLALGAAFLTAPLALGAAFLAAPLALGAAFLGVAAGLAGCLTLAHGNNLIFFTLSFF